MSKMNPVIHFEMPSENNSRMCKFYETAFGWQTHDMGAEMGSYVLATTTEVDEKTHRPKMPGAINGGFFPKADSARNKHTSIVIAVDDIKDAMKKIAQAGGTVHGEPVMIPGVGQYVSFTDTEGNYCSILQPMGR